MTTATFSYEGIRIGVSLERDSDLHWLEEFLAPWFEVSGEPPDLLVCVDCDPTAFQQLLAKGAMGGLVNTFMLDTRIQQFPRWNGPRDQLTLYDEKHQLFFLLVKDNVRLLCAKSDLRTRKSVMRVLRELAMGMAQLTGGRFMHASSYAANGRAAIIAGPRQAGKTSLLSYVLTHSSAQFVSNDRLLVKRQHNSFQLKGLPTIVSIRDGTQDLLPGLRDAIARTRFTTLATLSEASEPDTMPHEPAREGRARVSPRQYCALLDCKPVSEATPAVLLLPRQTGLPGGLELSRLTVAQSRSRLQHCLFGHIGPDRLSDAFTTLPPGSVKVTATDDTRFCANLAEDLPAYECRLGNDTYSNEEGSTRLLRLLEQAI